MVTNETPNSEKGLTPSLPETGYTLWGTDPSGNVRCGACLQYVRREALFAYGRTVWNMCNDCARIKFNRLDGE